MASTQSPVADRSRDSDQGAPGLTDYIVAIGRRPWAVVVSLLLCLLLAFLFTSSRSERFTASNRVLVGPTPVSSTRDGVLVSPVLEREREVLSSLSTANLASELLGGLQTPEDLIDDLSVEFEPSTDTLVVSFTSARPAEAAEVANAFATSYVQLRQSAADRFYTTQLELIEARIAANRTAMSESAAAADELAGELGTLRSVEPTALGRIESLNSQIFSLRQEVNQLAATIRVDGQALASDERTISTSAPTAEVLSTASIPSTPDGIASSLVYIVASLVGLGLGVTTCLILDRLDTRLKDRFAPGRLLGTPTLASIPSLGIRSRLSKQTLVMANSKGGVRGHMARESIRRLRSSLGFVKSTSENRVFVFTSAHPGEGKTTVVSNLAVALAQAGERVILVSADLRRPRLEQLFGVEPTSGLAESLGGAESVGLVDTDYPSLSILTAGLTMPSNPGELLSSDRAVSAFTSLAEECDYLLVDTPPILAAADTAALAARLGQVVLVVDSLTTNEDELLRTKDELDQVGVTIVGTVLNRDASQNPRAFGRKSNYYRAS